MAVSFAAETKAELCRRIPERKCCKKAEMYGFFLFGKSFSPGGFSVSTESHAAARKASQQIAEIAGVMAETSVGVRRKGAEQPVMTVSIPAGDESRRALAFFCHRAEEVSLRISRDNLQEENCLPAFLRGAFLSCGTVTQPEKEYHLEFSVLKRNLAQDLCVLLQLAGLGISVGMASRRGGYVVYINGAEFVGDLLAYMGASSASLELIQTKIVKEIRNNVNRKMNFESANQDKTADAAARQVLAIQRIIDMKGISSLPEELQELARLRCEYPEYSLRELGQRLNPPISRSGVNHRLNKLVRIAENLEEH